MIFQFFSCFIGSRFWKYAAERNFREETIMEACQIFFFHVRLLMKILFYGFMLLEAFAQLLQICVSFSSVQSLSCVWLFATPWIAARQVSLSITNCRSSLRVTSIESVMPSSHLILCRPLLIKKKNVTSWLHWAVIAVRSFLWLWWAEVTF